ncbi:MAG: hypothetical protein SGJ27_00605 [Candidatus Melainabacteria bacterium]|nr:hypothetical protein [Candidatus Melainabacteria bacterium]
MITGTISGIINIDCSIAKIVKFIAYGEGESPDRNDTLTSNRTYPIIFAMVCLPRTARSEQTLTMILIYTPGSMHVQFEERDARHA